MDKILNFLSNPLVAFFLTLLSVIIAIILYYHSPPKVIKCLISSNQLIDNTQSQFSSLNILYGGKQAEKLIVSEVTFWNSSFSTIKKEDLIKKSPFSVTVNDGEILELSVLGGKDTPNQIGVDSIDDCSAKIYFDYLDHKEGGIIQIVHTGNQEINISKELMGGKIVKDTPKSIKTILFSSILGAIYGILIPLLILLYSSYYDFKIESRDFVFITLLPFCMSFSIFILSFIVSSYYYKKYIPKNCKKEKIRKK